MNRPTGKIIVVGPVAPFRGGIAQHTTRLANALAESADTLVVGFSRLYPRRLYPGRFLTESSGLAVEPPIEPLLDSIHPPSWRRAAARIEALSPACVVIPWWTFFLAPCYRYLARRLRRGGIPVLFCCHNVVDHEDAYWKRWLARMVLRQGDGFLVSARGEADRLRHLLGDVEIADMPHPVFDQFPLARGLLPRRAPLELLFYGFIRPYKGLDVLLDALAGLDDPPWHLTIVGEPWGEGESVWRERIEATGSGDRIEFVPRYVSDLETAEYFARTDAIVLPYRSATGTGVIPVAYRYRKPIIACRVGSLPDLVRDGETGLLVPPGDPAALRTAIRRFAREGLPGAAGRIEALAAEMTWERLAGQVLTFAGQLADRRGGAG